jgi:PBP1b-binding outer membrane lipoprotein LpoB
LRDAKTVPTKKEKKMKKIYAVLGVALLMGCGGNQEDVCGKKNIATETAPLAPVEQKTVAQEAPVKPVESITPSK